MSTHDWVETRTTKRFLTKPNWIVFPKRKFTMNREQEQFIGTHLHYYNLSTLLGAPIEDVVTYEFTSMTKEKEHTILDFFASVRGRLERFWLPLHKNLFTLYNPIGQFDGFIDVNQTFFNQVFQGNDYLFIELTNGCYISKKINSVTDYTTFERLNLSTPMDRNIEQNDIAMFGRLLLVRFDLDELKFKYHSDQTSSITIRFWDLIAEYADETEGVS